MKPLNQNRFRTVLPVMILTVMVFINYPFNQVAAIEGKNYPDAKKTQTKTSLVKKAKPERAIRLTPTQVDREFDQATQAARKLSRHQKLKTVMTTNIAKLAKLKKLQAEVERLVANLQKMSPKEKGVAVADAARRQNVIQKKVWEMMDQIADSEIDEAKDEYEKTKEQFKLALRILSEHMERMTQVIQKETS